MEAYMLTREPGPSEININLIKELVDQALKDSEEIQEMQEDIAENTELIGEPPVSYESTIFEDIAELQESGGGEGLPYFFLPYFKKAVIDGVDLKESSSEIASSYMFALESSGNTFNNSFEITEGDHMFAFESDYPVFSITPSGEFQGVPSSPCSFAEPTGFFTGEIDLTDPDFESNMRGQIIEFQYHVDTT